jgi:predicted porin
MKRRLSLLAVPAGIAYMHNAQSSNGQNQSTLVKFASGNSSGSRWGLKGI